MLSTIKAQLKPFMPLLLKAKEPWLVGGAIRDAIITSHFSLPTSHFKDFDFAIKGSGIEFARWFAHKICAGDTSASGIKGSFVLLDSENDEARVVVKIRNQKSEVRNLTFDFNGMKSIEEDLSRRDFRLNAMAAKLPEFKILDPFKGIEDIKKKRLRMVSEKCFKEDALRILRGFRLEATLGFKITPKTLEVMRLHKNLLFKIAPERIREELFLLLKAKNCYRTLRHMARLEILDVIIPETTPMREVPSRFIGSGNLLDHSMLTVKKVEDLEASEDFSPWFSEYLRKKLPVLKLAALLHDIGKPYCYTKNESGKVHFYGHEKKGIELLVGIRDRLRLSHKEFKTLQLLIHYHMRPHLLARERYPTDKAIWKFIRDGGEEAQGILLLAYADALASGRRGRKGLLKLLDRGIKMQAEFNRPKFKPLLTGNDLISLGLKPGPKFKEILQIVGEMQVSGELHTTNQALQFVKKNFLAS
ncbi:CCA tRNA nucleotidyltransferase [candidate division WOR-3 bacterium]|nr:CCA tRNA nucleotidyltransferase [candidate division WOR-3 bacterium]